MNTSIKPDNAVSIGDMPLDEVVAKLREMGDEETAADLEAARDDYYSQEGTLSAPDISEESAKWKRYWRRPWTSSEYSVGHLASGQNDELSIINYAGNITPSSDLRNARVKITLDRFRVASYPGLGPHRILLKFHAQNQAQDKSEDVHFNIICDARQGEHANIHSYPIFIGLNIGVEGINLEFTTVKVFNGRDKSFLGFLESDVFKSGLRLLTSVQPATALFVNMASNLTAYIAKNFGNTRVQQYTLGLDFSKTPDRYRLTEGSYIVVQIPEKEKANWKWDQWQYQNTNGLVVNRDNTAIVIPYNYLKFSISKIEDH
jgi:hypothetical protein